MLVRLSVRSLAISVPTSLFYGLSKLAKWYCINLSGALFTWYIFIIIQSCRVNQYKYICCSLFHDNGLIFDKMSTRLRLRVLVRSSSTQWLSEVSCMDGMTHHSNWIKYSGHSIFYRDFLKFPLYWSSRGRVAKPDSIFIGKANCCRMLNRAGVLAARAATRCHHAF